MSFKPLQTQTRAHSGVTLGYSTRLTKGGNKNTKTRTLEFSISPELVQQLKLKDGDILRIDADADQGLGRLLPVQVLNKASRKVFLSSTGRGAWQILVWRCGAVFPRGRDDDATDGGACER